MGTEEKIRYLSVHARVSGSQGGGEQPWEAIELRRLNAGRPDLRVLVAEEDVAVVELDGADERRLPEIWPGESIVRFVEEGSIVGPAEKAVVLEASRSAADLGAVEEVAVGVGDGDGGGGGGGMVAAQ